MITDLKLSVFGTLQAYESKPLTLDTILWWIRHDKSVAEKTELYRSMAKTITPDEAKKKVKEAMMPAFSVAVVFRDRGRQTQHVASVTGLSICDIDHIENVDDAFERLKADPYTFILYRTISGEGIRCIYRYVDEQGEPPKNAILYRAAYVKGNKYFATLVGQDYDGKCGDLTRLSGMAHDAEAYYNPEAKPFTITDAEAAEANLDPSTEPGKPRKNEPAGTYHTAADEAWGVVEKMLAKRDVVYGRGTHHAYVMHAAHLFNRFGTSEDSVIEWAAQAWADYGQKERNSIIHWVYANRQSQHGIWRLSKSGRSKKDSNLSLQDQVQWLSDHGIEIIYNQITDQSYFRRGPDKEWEQLDDRAVCTLRKDMNIETRRWVAKGDVNDIVKSDVAKLIHPVRDYINGLSKWDGNDRVAELANHVKIIPVQKGQSKLEAHDLFYWALHKWLVGTMATMLTDDNANQTIMTLIGEQGIYKSTFFRFLLPAKLESYYHENNTNSFSSKDEQIALTENCLVEIDEVDAFRDQNNADLKSFSTKVKIKIRRPYDRFMVCKHRLASLCATGNQERFLVDETGNRRWLCFLVKGIDDPREWALDYDQLYAQLRDEYLDGFPYYFNKKDEEKMKLQNEYFRIVSDEEQLIMERFRKPKPSDIDIKTYSAATIAQRISYGRMPISSRKVSLVMKNLGYTPLHSRYGNIYRVYELKPDEQQLNMLTLQDSYVVDNQPGALEQELPF